MPASKSTKTDPRTRLVRAAEKIVYRRGFRQTTLADIAREARVPLGNVYYYFKTKDDIGRAIIDRLVSQVRANLESFEEAGSPEDRLCACVDAVLASKEMLVQGGCPMGSLCTELQKARGKLAEEAAVLLEEQLHWMEAQFRSCGCTENARQLAVHLLAALQGISALVHSFRDPQLAVGEAAALKEWIRSL